MVSLLKLEVYIYGQIQSSEIILAYFLYYKRGVTVQLAKNL